MKRKPAPGMVTGGQETGSVKLQRQWLSVRGMLVLIASFLLLAGAALGLYMILPTSKDETTTKKAVSEPVMKQAGTLEKSDVSYEQLGTKALADKVNYLIGTKQYAEAEKLVRTQNGLDTDKDTLMLLLLVLEKQDKSAEALEVSERLSALKGLSSGEYIAIAGQYEAQNNKGKAIENYRKAIEVYNTEKQGAYVAEVARLEAKIKELQ